MKKDVKIPIFEPGVLSESIKLGIPPQILALDRPGGIYAVRQLAREVRTEEMRLGEKYLALCEAIREEEMQKATVKWVLAKEGFRKQRIAEIWRVATGPVQLFNDYKQRLIGFKGALEAIRGGHEDVGEKAKRELSWNKALTAFDRHCKKWPAPSEGHVANQQVFCTWKFKDVSLGKPKTFSFHGWRVTVEKVEPKHKPASKKGKKSHDKETSNGSVPAGGSNDGSGIPVG